MEDILRTAKSLNLNAKITRHRGRWYAEIQGEQVFLGETIQGSINRLYLISTEQLRAG